MFVSCLISLFYNSAVNKYHENKGMVLQLYITSYYDLSFAFAATLSALGSAFGYFFGGWISEIMGKRFTLFASNLVVYMCWMVTAFAHTKWLLFLSDSLNGFFISIAVNCVGNTNQVKNINFMTFSSFFKESS